METRITGKTAIFRPFEMDETVQGNDLSFVPSDEIDAIGSNIRDYLTLSQPAGTKGTWARLNQTSFAIACRWNTLEHSIEELRSMLVTVRDPRTGRSAMAKPIHWGPAIRSGRVAMLTTGLADYLGVDEDDIVEVTIPTATVNEDFGAVATIDTIEYTFIQAKSYQTGRSRSVQNIILHGSDAVEEEDLQRLTKGMNSVHWYVTRDGRYYQFVDNGDTAIHVGRAASTLYSNAATIGVEHEHCVGDDWPDDQIKASANLCAYICNRYGLTESNILTHEFVAEPRGRVSDPENFPRKKFFAQLNMARKSTWIAKSVVRAGSEAAWVRNKL